jgi:hypothetical protein
VTRDHVNNAFRTATEPDMITEIMSKEVH